jgi:hypothetical protein
MKRRNFFLTSFIALAIVSAFFLITSFTGEQGKQTKVTVNVSNLYSGGDWVCRLVINHPVYGTWYQYEEVIPTNDVCVFYIGSDYNGSVIAEVWHDGGNETDPGSNNSYIGYITNSNPITLYVYPYAE